MTGVDAPLTHRAYVRRSVNLERGMTIAPITCRGIVVLLLGVPLAGCYSWQGRPKGTSLREYVARKQPERIVVSVRDSTPCAAGLVRRRAREFVDDRRLPRRLL